MHGILGVLLSCVYATHLKYKARKASDFLSFLLLFIIIPRSYILTLFRMKFSARLRKGFTLIELLIVIVIIGILAVGLVPKVIDAPKRARDVVRKKDMDSIKVALESFYADNSSAYPSKVAFTDASTLGLGSYFQGSVFPAGSDGATKYYYSLGNGSTTCYILAVKMDVTSSGNSATDPNGGAVPTCAVAAGYATGANKPYMYVVGGN